jgi:hypothetical protein
MKKFEGTALSNVKIVLELLNEKVKVDTLTTKIEPNVTSFSDVSSH